MKARIVRPTAATLGRLARLLRSGEVVAVPTETVYGLAANALDAEACRTIFEIKGRPSNDPLIVHVPSLAAAEEVAVFSPQARDVAKAFWPGPLTLVLPKRAVVPAIVTSGLDSVAVRVPRHPAFQALLVKTQRPLAAPSANPFGYISPTTAQHVFDNLGTKISDILDGGPCRVGVESTIVDLRDPRKPRLLRPGWITARDIARATGIRISTTKPRQRASSPASATATARSATQSARGMVAPGMSTKHYSPRTPLRLVAKINARELRRQVSDEGRTAWVYFSKPAVLPQQIPRNQVYWFSGDGGPAQAARALFKVLRALDGKGYARIVAEKAPSSPQAESLNDRLRRAAAKS